MDAGGKRPKMRIISGSVTAIEGILNELLEYYAALRINFAVVHDELVLTVVLIDQRELRMAAMMQPGGPGGPRM